MSNHPSSSSQPNDIPILTTTATTPPDTTLSPPNQPRQSLSSQLAPDYHDWVSDVSSHKPLSTTSSHQTKTPSSTASSSNRFLDAAVDAVTGRNKSLQQQQEQARARRANQPSFSGSAFTSDNDDNDYEQEQEQDDQLDNDDEQQGLLNHKHRQPSTNDQHLGTLDNNDSNGTTPTPRLPPLSKSQVNVPDPSRPAYKLGAPLSSKPPRAPSTQNNKKLAQEPALAASHPSDNDHHLLNETSSLLGNGGNRSRNPQGNGTDRWTNEGSRRRTPRYNGPPVDTNQQDIDGNDLDNNSEADSLRRPSRARSLSPNMESRRGNRGRVIFRNYPSATRRGNSNANRALQNLRRSSMANINLVKEKLLTRRSGYYDDAKEALVKENNGIRIWYHNYTTIDWIHDFVKERVRLRHLRSIGGIRGMLKNRADSLKGWVLVLLTGVITACLAAFIDVSSWWLGDLRMGYCTTNFWWSQYFCCWGATDAGSCPEWVSWSQALSSDKVILGLSRDTFDWIVYCCFGVLFAGICVVMVTSDGTVSQQKSHGATKRRNGPNSHGGSGTPEVKTILGGFVIRGFLGFRTLMIKLIGLPLMVASGLNMGKQGPLVHIACCVANIVCRIFD
ncbi:hypothetical protein BGZ95_004059, partial [Linnemannia exigua]